MTDEADMPNLSPGKPNTSWDGLHFEAGGDRPSIDETDADRSEDEAEEDFYYKMTSSPRGVFLIFNHEEFDDKKSELPRRSGTSVDKAKLVEVWGSLGFDVQSFDNLSRKEIEKQIAKYSQNDYHNDYDCFGCAILTHGQEDDTLHARDKSYQLQESIIQPFRHCSSLAGKPKLFFIQACRGQEYDKGHRLEKGYDATDGIGFKPEPETEQLIVPLESDFLIAHSTTQGFYAWRDPEKGSWFIENLAKMIQKHHKYMDMLQMLTMVNRDVAMKTSQTKLTTSSNKKQCPSIVTRLTRLLHFGPKDQKMTRMIPAQSQNDVDASSTVPKRGYYETKLKMIRKKKELADLEETLCQMKLGSGSH